jgi:hypothetical protein
MRAALPETEAAACWRATTTACPTRHFSEQEEFYGKTQDIDALLRKRHADMLNEMRVVLRTGALWYVQRITRRCWHI